MILLGVKFKITNGGFKHMILDGEKSVNEIIGKDLDSQDKKTINRWSNSFEALVEGIDCKRINKRSSYENIIFKLWDDITDLRVICIYCIKNEIKQIDDIKAECKKAVAEYYMKMLMKESNIFSDDFEFDIKSVENIDREIYLTNDDDRLMSKLYGSMPTRSYNSGKNIILEEAKMERIDWLIGMQDFKNELIKIKKHKFDKYYGVPCNYVISEYNKYEIAYFLIHEMYNSNMLLSEQVLERDQFVGADRGDNPKSSIDIVRGRTFMISVPRLSGVGGGILRSDIDSVSVQQLSRFITNIKDARNNIFVIFVTDDVSVQTYITETMNSVGINCKGFLPETITSNTKCHKILKNLAKNDGFEKFTGSLPTNIVYTPMELTGIYDNWKRECLFKKINGSVTKNVSNKNGEPLLALQNMIGLTEVKQAVAEITAHFKMQEILKERAIIKTNTCKHMMFYGNPGTAKSTVARLIGTILKENGVLESGVFVEVSRNDLVSEFLGGTAPKTMEAIIKAKGGILFIDEAYSLLESKGRYGDEAINTLVQQMDVIKDHTIIIFAGYPEKMKDFLSRNEGLRSRIPFHIKFKNYKKDELIQILKLMAEEKKFVLTSSAIKIAKKQIDEHIEDEDFGNGRFMRNLLEKAMMKQSLRLLSADRDYKKISTKELTTIEAKDINTDMVSLNKEKVAGFRA